MTHIQLERRNDLHCEHLIDVALQLQKAHGAELARDYLEEVNVPEKIIVRVLSRTKVRELDDEDEAELGVAWLSAR
ncbi:MAG: hypothetical protein V7631_3718 [Massilia sp.]|jgi:hypothetical protein